MRGTRRTLEGISRDDAGAPHGGRGRAVERHLGELVDVASDDDVRVEI